MQLRIDTYEDQSSAPVLSHTFYGDTQADIQAIIQAHMATDTFFRASMTTGVFRGMRLTNTEQWSP